MIEMLATAFLNQKLNRRPTDQCRLAGDPGSELADCSNDIQRCHGHLVTWRSDTRDLLQLIKQVFHGYGSARSQVAFATFSVCRNPDCRLGYVPCIHYRK